MYKDILLPVDLDQPVSWEHALPQAVKLCEMSGANLHVLTVVPDFGMSIVSQYFPEEFRNFLGVRGELRSVLERHHGDLFGVRFWRRVQDRVRSGEVIEIFPYERSRRLGAGIRRRTSAS